MTECGSSCRGLEESIFQTPSLLHMTLGTLALMDEVERQKVSEILEDTIKKEIKDQLDDLGSIDVKGTCELLVLSFCIHCVQFRMFIGLSISH